MPRGRGQKLKRPERMELIQRALQMHLRGTSQCRIAEQLDLSQSTISVWISRYCDTPQQRIAAKIRAELVCCDIYAQMLQHPPKSTQWRDLRWGKTYHAICFYGEFAARIAEEADAGA